MKTPSDSLKLNNYYLSLYITEYTKGDTLFKYSILLSGYNIKKTDMDRIYPPFYTYVDGKLVLIYINSIKQGLDFVYSNSSKRKLRKEVNRYLEKESKVSFYDDNNKFVFRDKHFKEDYFYGGVINIYIFRKHSPVIIYSPE